MSAYGNFVALDFQLLVEHGSVIPGTTNRLTGRCCSYFDPEDIQHGLDPEDAAEPLDNSAAREHYIDAGPSSLRKLHDSISDPKYEGVKTTRKQLLDASDDDMSEDAEANIQMDDDSSEDSAGKDREASDDEEIPSDSEATSPEDEEKENAPKTLPESTIKDASDTVNMTSTLQKTREDDRRKGKAISRQIALWDSLLDARIRIQKAIVSSNKLPLPSQMHEAINSDENCRTSLQNMLHEAASLSDELFQLQSDLLSANTDITTPPRKRRKVESLESITDYNTWFTWFEDATGDASALENAIHPYQLQTLSKWSSKIQAVAPSVLLPSNRNAFSKNRQQQLKSVVQLIDETLSTDQSKLLARTQVRRSKHPRLGASGQVEPSTDNQTQGEGEAEGGEGEVVDTELFDDTDFYQQLLRDIIDARGDTIGSSADWLVLQKQKKAKKKVDTKASKGRKLRYEIHEKLQNFMVPVPVTGAWHEEQIDELFASLLGKGFEDPQSHSHSHSTANPELDNTGYPGLDVDVDVDVEAEKKLQEQVDASLKGGFRVFG